MNKSGHIFSHFRGLGGQGLLLALLLACGLVSGAQEWVSGDLRYRIIGDVKHNEVDPLCSWVTPVPGGVGPLTIVSLLENTMKAYKRHCNL